MNIYLLTLYLNNFNESKLMFGRTLRKLFFLFFFCGKIKLICELRHTFFINLPLRQIKNLRPSALLYKNQSSAAGKFGYSAVCGNTYAPHQVAVWQLQAVPLIIRGSPLTLKVANKCQNIREWVEKIERNKRWSSLFPSCPVNRQRL